MVDQKRFFLKASGHFWQEAVERALPQRTQFGNKQPRTNTIFLKLQRTQRDFTKDTKVLCVKPLGVRSGKKNFESVAVPPFIPAPRVSFPPPDHAPGSVQSRHARGKSPASVPPPSPLCKDKS